jgi:hypothetical protein
VTPLASLRVRCTRCGRENTRVQTNPMTGATYEDCGDCGHAEPVRRRPAEPADQSDRRQHMDAMRGTRNYFRLLPVTILRRDAA